MKKKITFLISIFSIIIYLNAQQITPEERYLQFQGLKYLYESIENSNKSSLLNNWNFDNNPYYIIDNTWSGIKIDNEEYITELDISNKFLIAEFEGDSQNRFCLVYLPKLKKANLSNNLFKGFMPVLWFTENPNTVPIITPIYTLPELEYFNISNNNFSGILNIHEALINLKELYASSNNFYFITLNFVPQLKIIDISNNILGAGSVNILWNNTLDFFLETYNISNNNITFSSLWRASSPNLGYRNFFNETGLDFIYTPQNAVDLYKVMAYNRVRTQVGQRLFIDLPDVGQKSEDYPEIRDSLHYSWVRNGVPLNENTPFLERVSVTNDDFGSYHCIITYTGERLRNLYLTTQIFEVVDEINEPPTITIDNGLSPYQVLYKGGTSQTISFTIDDDIPFTEWVASQGLSSEIVKYPSHLEIIQQFPSVKVRDTSAMYIGMDTLTVMVCDFEGGCRDFSLYFEIIDLLYTPPVDSIMAFEDRTAKIFWNPEFYNSKPVKPDGYYLLVEANPNPFGAGAFTRYDSVYVDGYNSNYIDFNIPQFSDDFFMKLSLFSKLGDTIISADGRIIFIPMPENPEIITNCEIITDSTVFLKWQYRSNPITMGMLDNSNLYCMENENNYLLLSDTFYQDTTYLHEVNTINKTISYKLIKKAISFSLPEYSFELPYLQSNVMTVSNIIDPPDTLHAPQINSISVNIDKQMQIDWDISMYQDVDLKPENYMIYIDTCNDISGNREFQYYDSIQVIGYTNNMLTFNLPETETEYQLWLSITARNGNILSVDTSILKIPIPVYADSLISFSIELEHIRLKWQFQNDSLHVDLNGYNNLYYSQDSVLFDFIEGINPAVNIYDHFTNTTNLPLYYKLIKKTYSIGENIIEIELPYLESNILTVDKDVSIQEINKPEIKIYPNPVTDIISIESNEIIKEISIIDILGNKIKTFGVNALFINFEAIKVPKGVYFLEIKTYAGKHIQKMIKI